MALEFRNVDATQPTAEPIMIYASRATDVLVDIQGWYGTSTAQGMFQPGTMTKVLDTRSATRTGLCPTQTTQCTQIAAGTSRSVQITGRAGVPTSGVTAVVVNITSRSPAATGHFTLYQDGTTKPNTSNLSYNAAQTISNTAIVPVSASGRIAIYSAAASDVTLDVEGWYTSAHAVATYAYNANGSRCWSATGVFNTAASCANPAPGATVYSWDELNRLASVTTANGTSNYIYDADGNRLLRVDPASPANGNQVTRTLYLDNTELKRVRTTTTADRYYTAGGSAIAMRDSQTGTLTWLGTSAQGSMAVSQSNGTTTFAVQRYTPYGESRGTPDTLPTQRSFLGNTDDDVIDLNYMNARYYDADLGVFLSVDPKVNYFNPASLDPYGVTIQVSTLPRASARTVSKHRASGLGTDGRYSEGVHRG